MTQKPQETRRGMIRINPKMQWPTLHDTDMEVEDFYEEFEGVRQLRNDMRGLLPMERLLALKSCLRGSRLKTYDNVKKLTQEDGTFMTEADNFSGLGELMKKSKQLLSQSGMASRKVRCRR